MVLKDFGHGISMKTAQSVFDEYGPRMDVVTDWKDLKDPSSLEEVSCLQTSRCYVLIHINTEASISFLVSLTSNHDIQHQHNSCFVAESMYSCSEGLCVVGVCQAGTPES